MARPRTLRRLAVPALVVAAVAALALGLRPERVPVETAVASRGPLRVTVDGVGKTRVRDVYVVASPVSGHLERLALHEGDPVRAGEVVARVSAAAPSPLDARARAELAARVEAARALAAEAQASGARARAAAAQAERDLARARELGAGGSISPSEVEAASLAARTRAEEVRMADAASARAGREIDAARAALEGGAARPGDRIALRAPAGGRVLRVHRESEGPVVAGAPVLEVGDPADLEGEVELLTAQAVRVRPGAEAEIVAWGGAAPLRGRVSRIDPAAFTKVSALGVEEQRIHAVVVPEGAGWEALGDGFRLEARIVVTERPGTLKVPAAALFRERDRWATFVVEGGRARLRGVEVGESSGEESAVTGGLAEGERVVLHPGDALADGTRVRWR